MFTGFITHGPPNFCNEETLLRKSHGKLNSLSVRVYIMRNYIYAYSVHTSVGSDACVYLFFKCVRSPVSSCLPVCI